MRRGVVFARLSMKLLMRPKPKKGESFIGYLVRLTELNGYDTPSWILSLSDIDYMELQWTFEFVFGKTKGLDKLAQLTNNTLDDLNALVYSPANSSQGNTEHNYDFYGAPLNRSIIRPHQPKVCPKCVAELGYCLRIWDCSLVTTCPTHECMLLDSCPKCRRQIRAIRRSLSVCACGCDLRDVDPQFLAEDELAVSRRIYQLCGLPCKEFKERNENPLHSLDLRDFVIALTFIACLFRSMSWPTGRPSKSIKLRNGELHRLYSKAYSIFENWPHNFHQLLSNQSSGQVRLNPNDGRLDTALKREFGPFYEHLYLDLDQPQFDFMREYFAEYLTARLKSQFEEPRNAALAAFSEADKCISIREARRLLKITHRAMANLIAAGEMSFVIRNQGTTLKHLVRRSDVESAKRRFDQSLSTREVARELVVDCEVVRELARAGHLKTRWRPAVDGYHTIKFDRGWVEEFSASGFIPITIRRNNIHCLGSFKQAKSNR